MSSKFLILVCLALCGLATVSGEESECKTETTYEPSDGFSKEVTALSGVSTVLEKLTEPRVKDKLIFITEQVTKVCSALPVVGAAFSVLGTSLDIFVTKPETSDMKCMREQFKKINEKLDKIQRKLEAVDSKLDKIVKLMTTYHVYESYNQYYKEPILRTVSSYQEYMSSKETKYAQVTLDFSCLDDQPLHALSWLNRTIHNSEDPSGLQLLDFIFNGADKCDLTRQDVVVDWAESIFNIAGLAAAMDQICFGTYVQMQKPNIDKAEVMRQPEYQRRADRSRELVDSIKEVFLKSERQRQGDCFNNETTLKRVSFDVLRDMSCYCTVSADGCKQIDAVSGIFDMLNTTICLVSFGGNNYDLYSVHYSKDKSSAIMRNPFDRTGHCNFDTRVNLFVRKGLQCDPKTLEKEVKAIHIGYIEYKSATCSPCQQNKGAWNFDF